MYFLTTIYHLNKWYNCVVNWEVCSAKFQMFDKKLGNIWYLYIGFRKFMLTNATSDLSNIKYMERYNVYT